MTNEIRAAGGIVWRDDAGGAVPRVAVIHRERYNDWTLPKGKLDEGESDLQAAVREVGEETGARVAVSRRLIRVRYVVDADSPKTVAFWAMRYVSGEFTPNDEVDDLDWLSLPDARARLSYDVDRSVLDSFTALPVPQAIVALVRHGRAGKREAWIGDDRMRPLNPSGRQQARNLAAFLPAFMPERIEAADRVRCVQTVEPLAKLVGRDIEINPALSDEAYLEQPDATRAALLAAAKSTPSSVICSQGKAIPGLLQDLARRSPAELPTTRKGAAWVLAFADGEVISADYYSDASGR